MTGTGIDLFDIARMERQTAQQGAHLLAALFTTREQAACATMRRPAIGHAICFAVKEACLKALGTGLVGTMTWGDMDVALAGRRAFAVMLRGETARVAAGRGVSRLLVSVAVTRGAVVAWAVAVGNEVG